MAIQIDWRKIPERISKGMKLYFPRIRSSRTVTEEEVLKHASKGTVFDKGTLIAAKYNITRAIAEELSAGHAVRLNDLGTFRLQIGTGRAVSEEERSHTDTVRIEGISFTPSPEFLEMIGHPSFSWDQEDSCTDVAHEELTTKLNAWFENHPHITRQQFSDIFNMRRTTATKYINVLISNGFLYKEGEKSTTIYKRQAPSTIV